jgi:hypothetical protein
MKDKNIIKKQLGAMINIEIYTHIMNIELKMRQIPDLINTTTDIDLWGLMSTCNNIILELVDNDCLTDREINLLVVDYTEFINIIRDIVDATKFFMIHIYFYSILEYCMIYCEEEQLFEACANIKKFNDKL